MGELLGKYRSLKVYMDACVHCGACADKCHYFIGTQDPLNMPVARQDLMRSVYRRYFTLPGKLFPKLVGARDLTKEVLDEWYTLLQPVLRMPPLLGVLPLRHRHRRSHDGRPRRSWTRRLGQKYSNEIIGKVHRIGNNLGLPGPALADTLEGLEEDVKEETGVDVRFPLDEKGAEVLLVTPSADFFAEPHVDSLIGYAKVFHAAGIRWTLSSHASEAGNFGLFIGNYDQMRKIALRIREAALELGVKRIVVGECGHAWRVAYSFWNTLTGIGAGGDDPFAQQLQSQLDPRYKQPMHICELTWDLIERGALTFDKEANDHRIVTFHDSCNVARASRMGDTPGGQFEIPRAIIRAVANNYVEMRAGDDARGDVLLRRRRRPADRRPARPARQGRAAAHGGAAAGRRRARRQLHGDDLRDLQGAVHARSCRTTDSRWAWSAACTSSSARRSGSAPSSSGHRAPTTFRRSGDVHDPPNPDTEKLTFRRYKDGDAKWDSWREQIFQASYTHKCPTYIQSTPPCQGSCPSGEDIRGYLNIVRGIEKPPAGDARWQEYAWRRLTEANPFPSVMGRVCPAPCETGCNRNEVEDHVGINSVEHFLGEYAIANKLAFTRARRRRPARKSPSSAAGRPGCRAPTSSRARATRSRSSTSTSTWAA